jgi:hypothetical protein
MRAAFIRMRDDILRFMSRCQLDDELRSGRAGLHGVTTDREGFAWIVSPDIALADAYHFEHWFHIVGSQAARLSKGEDID